jgi:tetratricopeptide (TPR) repeat protein
MLLTIGNIYTQREMPERAKSLLDEALALARKQADPMLLARALNARGYVSILLDDNAHARPFLLETTSLLAGAQQDSDEWFKANSYLGWSSLAAFDDRQAVAILRPVLSAANNSAKIRPETKLSLLGTLALAYRQTKQLDLASELNTQAIALRQKIFGPQHINTAIGLANAGNLEIERGKFDRARELLTQALRVYDSISAKPMEYRGAARYVLGQLELYQGHYPQALLQLRQSAQERGQFKPEAAKRYEFFALRDQAQVLLAQEEFAKAVVVLRVAQPYLVSEKMNVVHAQDLDNKFAHSYCRLGQIANAGPYLLRLRVRKIDEVQPNDRPRHFYVLAECAWATHENKNAAALFEQMRAEDVNGAPGRALERYSRALRYAAFLREAGEPGQAEQELQFANRALEKIGLTKRVRE